MRKEVNIPNLLTLIRFIIGGVIAYMIFTSQHVISVILFVVAVITDLADGRIARKYKLETKFGKVFDAFTDKALFALIIFPLLYVNGFIIWIWIWAVSTIFTLITYYFFVKKEMGPSTFGRSIMIVEVGLVVILLLGYVNHYTIGVFYACFWLAAIHYIWRMK